MQLPTWPLTAPPPLTHGRTRAYPEDFAVSERMAIALSGDGEHVWLRIRKRGHNTDRVAQLLARAAGVGRAAVGYAGLKDRNAVTSQWFSVHLPGRAAPDWAAVLPDGIEVVEAARHARKLHTGALTGNDFVITVRECQGDSAALARRIDAVRVAGVPNYFGEQRFGRDGGNLARAAAMFAGTLKVRDRHLRGLYLSAARAFLFNTVLAERIARGCWDAPLPGEAFVLSGSRSFFVAEAIDDTLRARLAAGDIHPSGPLWGAGAPPTLGAVQVLEEAVGARHPALVAGLAAAGLKHERRALRVIPADLTAEWLDPATLRLRFGLPAGSYATAVLGELVACDSAPPAVTDNRD